MIIRIKKRSLLIASVSLILLILVPIIYSQTQTPRKAGFGVWIVIGNQNPTNVTLSNVSGFAIDPTSGGDTVFLISFNASDPDGAGQINGTYGGKVSVNVTLGTPGIAQFRTHTACVNTTINAGKVTFNCTITMKYYDNNSANWVINVTVTDSGSGSARNDTQVFTYNQLAAFSIIARGVSEAANLNFSSLNLGDSNSGAKAPILLNNTGNNDFDQINITAASLVGVTTPGETILATSFFVNITNGTAGAGLALSNSPQVIPGVSETPNATLLHGPGAVGNAPYVGTSDSLTRGNLSLIFWVDVPLSGLSAQTYNNTWNLTVVDIS